MNKENHDSFIHIQAKYFARFLAQYLGFSIRLVPSFSTVKDLPTYFIIEGEDSPLSSTKKVAIVDWAIANRPSWVLKWWRDEANENNIIDLNVDGDLCVASENLLLITLSLDPNQQEVFKKLGIHLSQKYHHEIEVSVHEGNLALSVNNKALEYGFFNKLSDDLEKAGKTVGDIGYHQSSSRIPRRVTAANSLQLSSGEMGELVVKDDPTVAGNGGRSTRFNRQYQSEVGKRYFNGASLNLVYIKNLLAFTELSVPEYLENVQPIYFPSRPFEKHRAIISTRWRLEGIYGTLAVHYHNSIRDHENKVEMLSILAGSSNHDDIQINSIQPLAIQEQLPFIQVLWHFGKKLLPWHWSRPMTEAEKHHLNSHLPELSSAKKKIKYFLEKEIGHKDLLKDNLASLLRKANHVYADIEELLGRPSISTTEIQDINNRIDSIANEHTKFSRFNDEIDDRLSKVTANKRLVIKYNSFEQDLEFSTESLDAPVEISYPILAPNYPVHVGTLATFAYPLVTQTLTGAKPNLCNATSRSREHLSSGSIASIKMMCRFET